MQMCVPVPLLYDAGENGQRAKKQKAEEQEERGSRHVLGRVLTSSGRSRRLLCSSAGAAEKTPMWRLEVVAKVIVRRRIVLVSSVVFLNSVYLACPLLSFFFFFLISLTFPSSPSFLPALLALLVFLLLSFAVCIFHPLSGFCSAFFFLPQVRGTHGCCWLT